MIVVDASVVVLALANDGPVGLALRRRLRDSSDLAAPELIDLEVTNSWRRAERSNRLTPARLDQAINDLRELRVSRSPHRALLTRCWELRHNVSVYDGVYVALAEFLDVPLLTADARLVAAPGPTCAFEVVTLA